MAAALFTGAGVALVTLFDDDGRLLVEETVEHAVDLVERGIAAVVVSGTTGESWALDVDERLELCAAAAEALDGRAPVIVGTGHLDDEGAARLVGAAADAGAAAVLALSPPHADDVRPHYEALAAHAGALAVLAYHFPAVSPPGIPVEILAELPIAGVKDSSGDAGRLVAELGAYDGPLYVGSSAYLALAGPLGATGAILSLANTDPEGCIAALAGDMEAQRALLPGHRESRVDFPAGLKRRLARMAGTPAAVRAS
jgi:4-hydroxy-tetrahydrodipicolinate synthase